jgi:hypothetical protein
VRAVAAFILAILSSALATRAEEPPRFASLTFDNDIFAGTDRHYTNGVQLALLVDIASIPDFARAAPPFSWSTDPQFVFALGQRIFTPTDIERSAPPSGDRPYAGWLYALGDWRLGDYGTVDHITGSLGVVGPAAGARQAQNGVHRLLHDKPARGWSSQIDNRAAWLLAYERAWRNLLREKLGSNEADVTPRVSVTVGNVFTYASVGVVARYGTALPDDIPATHISLGPARDGYRGAPRYGWYAWGGIDTREVARNVFIDAAWAHDGADIHRKSYGWDAQAGVTWALPELRIGLAYVRRSLEFVEQVRPDRFGEISISFAY